MIKRTTAIALTATLVSLGIGLPLSAQEADELPNVITQDSLTLEKRMTLLIRSVGQLTIH